MWWSIVQVPCSVPVLPSTPSHINNNTVYVSHNKTAGTPALEDWVVPFGWSTGLGASSLYKTWQSINQPSHKIFLFGLDALQRVKGRHVSCPAHYVFPVARHIGVSESDRSLRDQSASARRWWRHYRFRRRDGGDHHVTSCGLPTHARTCRWPLATHIHTQCKQR